VTGAPVRPDSLRAIVDAVQAEGAWLHILQPVQIMDLSAAAEIAGRTGPDERPWQAELSYWTGNPTTSISAAGDRAAQFAILYGRSDEPRDWLRAGEALSAGWLAAAERGVSVLPMSAPVEVTGTRETMRRFLSYLNHAFLVLRLGTVDPAEPEASAGARRPAEQIIERR
jgi:hypothetical protein